MSVAQNLNELMLSCQLLVSFFGLNILSVSFQLKMLLNVLDGAIMV